MASLIKIRVTQQHTAGMDETSTGQHTHTHTQTHTDWLNPRGVAARQMAEDGRGGQRRRQRKVSRRQFFPEGDLVKWGRRQFTAEKDPVKRGRRHSSPDEHPAVGISVHSGSQASCQGDGHHDCSEDLPAIPTRVPQLCILHAGTT